MKTKRSFKIIGLGFLFGLSYLNTTAQLWLTDGNAAVGGEILGTTTDVNLNFVTYGYTRMSLTSSANNSTVAGSLGIGTANPGSWGGTTFAGRIIHLKDDTNRTRVVIESGYNPGLILVNSSSAADQRIGGLLVIGQELQVHRVFDRLGSASMMNFDLARGRIGMNTSNATNSRLEIFEDANPQLRLTQESGAVYTDLQTLPGGHLYINSNSSSGAVLIGTDTEDGKLTVTTDANSYAGNFTSSNNDGTSALRASYLGSKSGVSAIEGINTASNGKGGEFTGSMFGAHGLCEGPVDTGTGLFGEAHNARGTNRGVYGYASSTNPANGASGYGGYFLADWGGAPGVQPGLSCGVYGSGSGGNNKNYGGFFYANNAGGAGSINYGVWAEADNSATNNYGIYAKAPIGSLNYAGYFDGDLNVNGSAYCTGGMWATSDKRFKKNIAKITDGLDKIMKLNAVSYEFNTEEYKKLNFPSTKQVGFIAQELKEVIPEAVHQDSKGYYSVDYTKVIPVLTKAIQEQQAVIETLQGQVRDLMAGKSATVTGIIDPINPADAPILSQNNPNPFSQSTTINYQVPQLSQSASIYVYDLTGKQLKKYRIEQKGKGNILINAGDLNPGTFIYTLIIDGREIASKKMILTDN